MKRFILLYFIVFSHLILGQQEQQYGQYMLNPFTINPAVAGTEDILDLQLGARQQWAGFEGAPRTMFVTLQGTVGKNYDAYHHKGEHQSWHGFGAQVNYDQTGPIKRNSVLLAYAYNIGLTKKLRLSFGTYVGLQQLQTNKEYWENIDDWSDDLFIRDLNTGLKPALHIGSVLYHPDFFVKMSVWNVTGNVMQFEINDLLTDRVNQAAYRRHMFFSGGVKLKTTDDLVFTPSFLMKYTTFAPLSIDLNLKIDIKQKYWTGVSYRAMDAFAVLVGGMVTDLIEVSYAFEWSHTRLRRYNAGTHEILLGILLNPPKNSPCPAKYW